jgi:uncharacterized protein (TIGR02284 family)
MADDRQLTRDPISGEGSHAAGAWASARFSGLPDSEMKYWLDAYTSEPYFEEGRHFEDYSPAYEIGWTGYHDYGGQFDTADCVMATDWTVRKCISSLSWEQARAASRAAWQRAENARKFTTDGSATTEETLAALNELLEDAQDGELGFREAAEHVKTPGLSALFGRCAQNCREAAAELQEAIERLGGQVEPGSSVGGAAHRVWIHIREFFGGASGETMPTECAPGEDALLGRYRKALKQNLHPEIHVMVRRQFERAQRNCDMIKSLRDRDRARARAQAITAA